MRTFLGRGHVVKPTLDGLCLLAAARGKALRLMADGRLVEVEREEEPVRARCWRLTELGERVAEQLDAEAAE
jgi:hypothetical protein